ncbi:MAG: hypothetical protein II213_06200, partial [Lachnospiraceae bacterium]|nr:hypothetical protein [Lachnospiraceae bacterium]
HASEDIGMADSNALLLAISAHYALKNLGIPEGNLALSHAIIYACEAEKSNSVYLVKKLVECVSYDLILFIADDVVQLRIAVSILAVTV